MWVLGCDCFYFVLKEYHSLHIITVGCECVYVCSVDILGGRGQNLRLIFFGVISDILLLIQVGHSVVFAFVLVLKDEISIFFLKVGRCCSAVEVRRDLSLIFPRC